MRLPKASTVHPFTGQVAGHPRQGTTRVCTHPVDSTMAPPAVLRGHIITFHIYLNAFHDNSSSTFLFTFTIIILAQICSIRL